MQALGHQRRRGGVKAVEVQRAVQRVEQRGEEHVKGDERGQGGVEDGALRGGKVRA